MSDISIVREPKIYLVGRQRIKTAEIGEFLRENETTWTTDTEVGAEKLCEIAGRLCYMSFGKGRKTNREYLGHILEVGHGSVLEHAVWNFIITGVSRSFTHELIRHRVGFSYSQLSQRYVDESTADYVEPDCIASDPQLHALWLESVSAAQRVYRELVAKLSEKFANYPDTTMRRKMARQAARSVLPNACETKIFVTANARAIRHFIELRANEHADVEISAVAIQLLRIMQHEAPNIFGDYTISTFADGSDVAETSNRKV